jgi:hypothetical protein
MKGIFLLTGMRAAVKTIHYLLAGLLMLSLTGCERLEKDMLAAPDDDQLQRYGLDSVKLGDKRTEAAQHLQALLKQPLQCKSGKTGLGDQRKAYITETCTATPVNGQVGTLWDEKLTALSATFVENQLCQLSIQLQTSGDYTALYDKHGKKILNLFGKPDETSAQRVQWLRQGDEAIVKDKGEGKVSLEISNKQVMQALHHKSN